MILQNNNIQEWKNELDSKFMEQHKVDSFSKTESDEYWIENYLDEEPQAAIDDETQYWDE